MTKLKKLAILMAGGSAAGKTTARKLFAQGEPIEAFVFMTLDMRKGPTEAKVSYTLYDNCSVTGNHHSGADGNSGPAAHRASFERLLPLSDIIIVDGKINSPQWIEMVNDACDEYDMGLLLLYFNVSAETLLTRLAQRRGVEKESIRESMYQKCVEATGRADLLVRNTVKLSELDWWQIDIDEDMTPEDIVDEMDAVACEWFGDC